MVFSVFSEKSSLVPCDPKSRTFLFEILSITQLTPIICTYSHQRERETKVLTEWQLCAEADVGFSEMATTTWYMMRRHFTFPMKPSFCHTTGTTNGVWWAVICSWRLLLVSRGRCRPKVRWAQYTPTSRNPWVRVSVGAQFSSDFLGGKREYVSTKSSIIGWRGVGVLNLVRRESEGKDASVYYARANDSA